MSLKTNLEVICALNSLETEFPDGRYWNHDPNLLYDSTNPEHPKITTASACTHHASGCSHNGRCGCNSFGDAIQCVGFAKYMADRVFGSYPQGVTSASDNEGDCENGWKKYGKTYFVNMPLEPGDLIQTESHRAIVHSVRNNLVRVAEVWGNLGCKIAWGSFNGKDSNDLPTILNNIKYILKAPKKPSSLINVTFGFRDNKNPSVTKQVYPGSIYGSVPSPLKENDLGTFIGWWDHPTNQTTEYKADTLVMTDQPHTLYAHWASTFKIANVGASGKCLNIHGSNLTSLKNDINVTLWSDSDSNEQKWLMTSAGTGRVVKSIIDPEYGLNVKSPDSTANCNIHKTYENEHDALVDFILQSDGTVKIKLSNYDLYLTATGTANGADVKWQASSDSNLQKWTVTIL